MTGSQSAIEPRLRLVQRRLDVAAHLDHPEAVLEEAVQLDQPELPLPSLERQPGAADEQRARAVEHAHVTEHAPRRGHELGGRIDERPHDRHLPDVSRYLSRARYWDMAPKGSGVTAGAPGRGRSRSRARAA